MADIMEKFWAAPPVSRTLVAAMFAQSALVHGGLLSPHRVVFVSRFVFKLPVPEIWRLASTFLLTGGGFSFVFDLYFMWIYGTGLELNSPRFTQPGDFLTYLVFIASAILLTGGFLLGGFVLMQSLMLAMIYTFAQDNRGQKAHFILFQIPVELLPWAMLLLTLIMGGPTLALQQATGVFAAHLYDFLTRLYPTFQGGRNYIQTPAIVKRWFGSNTGTYTQKAYGSTFRPAQAQPQAAAPSRGWTSGFSSGAWGNRGQGHRLGGE